MRSDSWASGGMFLTWTTLEGEPLLLLLFTLDVLSSKLLLDPFMVFPLVSLVSSDSILAFLLVSSDVFMRGSDDEADEMDRETSSDPLLVMIR